MTAMEEDDRVTEIGGGDMIVGSPEEKHGLD